MSRTFTLNARWYYIRDRKGRLIPDGDGILAFPGNSEEEALAKYRAYFHLRPEAVEGMTATKGEPIEITIPDE